MPFMLDVAIGLIFVYLVLSLLCSAISEALEHYLRYRAHYLHEGIKKLLLGTDASLCAKLYDHPLIKSLYTASWFEGKGRSKGPSYIPSRQFVLALLDVVANPQQQPAAPAGAPPAAPGGAPAGAPAASPVAQLRAALDANKTLPAPLVQALRTLINDAGDDIEKVKANIQQWFDGSMDRVSGWYKRRAQFILLVIGAIVAVAVNVDTLSIIDTLSNDAAVRTAVVNAADAYVRQNQQATGNSDPRANAQPASPATSAGANATANPGTTAGTTAATTAGTPAGTTGGTAPGTTAGTTPGTSAGTTAGAPAGTKAGATPSTTAGTTAGTTAPANPGTAASTPAGTTAGTTAGTPAPATPGTAAGTAAATTAGTAPGTSAGTSAPANPETQLTTNVRESVEAVSKQLGSLGLPVGWRTADTAAGGVDEYLPGKSPEAQTRYRIENRIWPTTGAEWREQLSTHLLGWALTAFALSFGAPFWFDMLNKIMVIRSTVKPREKSGEEGSEDRPLRAAAQTVRIEVASAKP